MGELILGGMVGKLAYWFIGIGIGIDIDTGTLWRW
jgi:hypothetical protein